MPTLVQLNLYTTSNCHLCEYAAELLASIDNIALTYIEIADSDILISLYGTRIPVLQKFDTPSDELNWPFSQQDIVSFLSK